MIPNGYLTLDRSHPDFKAVISGRFSKNQIAQIQHSLNSADNFDRFTFLVRDAEPVSFFKRWFAALKFSNLHWLLFPLLLILVKNVIDENLGDELLATLSCLGALCLQWGFEMANDVQDRAQGLDRIHPRSANKALHEGYLRSYELARASKMLVILGILLGLPSVLIFPRVVWVVGPFLILGLIGYLFNKTGIKYRGWSELLVFLFFGPVLTEGFQMSFGGGFDLEAAAIGILTGWLAVFQLHLKNFRFLMINAQAELRNTTVLLGFEKSKALLVFWWMVFIAFSGLYFSVFAEPEFLYLNLIFQTWLALCLIRWTSRLNSPLGSQMINFVDRGNRMVLATVGLWSAYFLSVYFRFEFLR